MSSPGQHLDQAPREFQDYRSISGWAICALLLGALSVSALAHPAAWVIPLIAVLCAIVAQFRIARKADVLQGRFLALVGMTLALFFGTWAVSRQLSENWLLNRQARAFAEQWLQSILDGDLEVAHQATLDYYHRQPEGSLLKEYYQEHPEDLTALQEFFSDGMLSDVVGLKGKATFRFDEVIGVLREPDSSYVSLRYFIDSQDAQQEPLHLQLELLRLVRPDGVYWSMLNAEDTELYRRPY